MTASYKIGEIPFIRGAGLRGEFTFSAIRFIAMQMPDGVYNEATAYHLIDAKHFPLEMQLIAENVNEKVQISFFFTQQAGKNFCLEPLMTHLETVRSIKSFKSMDITFCLDQIIPKIESGFYVYDKYVTIDGGQRAIMRFIVEPNALIPIGSIQLERIQAIQQNLIFQYEESHSDEINKIYLRRYLRHRRSSRLLGTKPL